MPLSGEYEPSPSEWVRNQVEDPHVELQDGMGRTDRTAREITGTEREQWWQRCVETYPPYAEYQTKTDRVIPAFVLETDSAG